MQRTPSKHPGVLQDDLRQVIRRAEIARVQFLREHTGRAAAWSALACGLALLVAAMLDAAGVVHDVWADAAAVQTVDRVQHPLR